MKLRSTWWVGDKLELYSRTYDKWFTAMINEIKPSKGREGRFEDHILLLKYCDTNYPEVRPIGVRDRRRGSKEVRVPLEMCNKIYYQAKADVACRRTQNYDDQVTGNHAYIPKGTIFAVKEVYNSIHGKALTCAAGTWVNACLWGQTFWVPLHAKGNPMDVLLSKVRSPMECSRLKYKDCVSDNIEHEPDPPFRCCGPSLPMEEHCDGCEDNYCKACSDQNVRGNWTGPDNARIEGLDYEALIPLLEYNFEMSKAGKDRDKQHGDTVALRDGKLYTWVCNDDGYSGLDTFNARHHKCLKKLVTVALPLLDSFKAEARNEPPQVRQEVNDMEQDDDQHQEMPTVGDKRPIDCVEKNPFKVFWLRKVKKRRVSTDVKRRRVSTGLIESSERVTTTETSNLLESLAVGAAAALGYTAAVAAGYI